jgi:YhcH/YjgK/YiaL family protein
MIIDKLSNSHLYSKHGTKLLQAFDYLEKNDFSKIQPGKYEIEGDNIFAIVNEYQTKNESEGKPESHKKYIDVQYVFKGSELMGYAQTGDQEIIEIYNEKNDITFYCGECSFIKLDAGMFAIFFPGEVHLPGIKIGEKSLVKKVVVKIKVNQFTN